MLSVVRRAVLSTVVVLVFAISTAESARAQTPPRTTFGSLFNPAHMPDGVTTTDDFHVALRQSVAIGGYASFMHDWKTGEAGLIYLGFMVPAARQYGMKVFLQLSPTSIGQPMPPEGVPASFAAPQARARYLADVERLASFHPDYLNLCAEVNLTFALAPSEATSFASLYKEAYALVKRVSPNTQVGVSYHMDMFLNLQEGHIPPALGPQDYVGFTSYPAWLLYEHRLVPTPADLPISYYGRLREQFPTQPIVFAEVGWPSGGRGNAQDQEAYVAALPRLMGTVRPALVIWAVLTDSHGFSLGLLTEEQRQAFHRMNVDPAVLFAEFNSMGLMDWNGLEKLAYHAARRLVF